MKDGLIDVDTKRGDKFGFSSNKFTRLSYLWKDGERIIISLMNVSKQRQGYLTSLINNIHKEGYKVVIPTPSNMMLNFLNKNHFEQTWENTEQGLCEMWIK